MNIDTCARWLPVAAANILIRLALPRQTPASFRRRGYSCPSVLGIMLDGKFPYVRSCSINHLVDQNASRHIYACQSYFAAWMSHFGFEISTRVHI